MHQLSETLFLGLLLGLSSVIADLNFNDDLEYNKKFDSRPTTVKTFENDTVLLPCYPKNCKSILNINYFVDVIKS